MWIIERILTGIAIVFAILAAIVLLNPHNPDITDSLPHTGAATDIQKYIAGVCVLHDIDPKIVNAIIERESCWQENAANRETGCAGLMQLHPETLNWLESQTGCRYDPFDARQNIAGGVYLLRYLLDWYGGDLPSALLAYAEGVGEADRMISNGTNPKDQWQYTTIMERVDG